jgi:hypothetical protein
MVHFINFQGCHKLINNDLVQSVIYTKWVTRQRGNMQIMYMARVYNGSVYAGHISNVQPPSMPVRSDLSQSFLIFSDPSMLQYVRSRIVREMKLCIWFTNIYHVYTWSILSIFRDAISLSIMILSNQWFTQNGSRANGEICKSCTWPAYTEPLYTRAISLMYSPPACLYTPI